MKSRLIWKLLLVNILPVIIIVVCVIWLAIDQLAADYFTILMEQYDVSPTETHRMFLAAVHRYLVWASLAGLVLALALSYLLIKRVLHPLSRMTAISRNYAAGRFRERVEVRSQDEIGQLATAFNRMADSLERLEMLRKRMVIDVAHELRTPLTNLRGYLEALSDGVIPPDKGTLRMLQDEILRLVHLVEDLGQLARAEAAKAHLDRREMDLHRAIEQMLDLCRTGFEEKEISLEKRFKEDTAIVQADRDKVLQAIRNLLENCRKYTPRRGSVTISTAKEDGTVRVSFANSGRGIAAEDIPYVFERFYRADRSRSRDIGGAGIGLSIVRELVEAHGGQVGAESEPGRTVFWFTLPLDRSVST